MRRSGIVEQPGVPRIVEAVSLALTLLRTAKKTSWPEMVVGTDDDGHEVIELPYEIELTERQIDLLADHHDLLRYVQKSTPERKDGDGNPIPGTGAATVTIAACPECGRWMMMSSGSAPARCVMSADCDGSPVKAGFGKLGTAPSARLLDAEPSDLGHISEGKPAEDDIQPPQEGPAPDVKPDEAAAAGEAAAVSAEPTPIDELEDDWA